MADTSVYWLHLPDEHTDPYNQGYIGITSNTVNREYHHRWTGKLSNTAIMTIIYEGSRADCMSKEFEYRPLPNIGWNKAVGGTEIAGSRIGLFHTEETKIKMSLAKLGKKRKPRSDEHRRKISQFRSGQKLPPLTSEHRLKLSIAAKLDWEKRKAIKNGQ